MNCQGRTCSEGRTMSGENTKSNTSAEEDPRHSQTEIDTGVTLCSLSADRVGSLPSATAHSNSNRNIFGTDESLDKSNSLETCNSLDDVNLSGGHRNSGSGSTNVRPSKHTNIREASFCRGKTLRQLQKQQGGPCYVMQSGCRSVAPGQAIHDGSGTGTLTTATSLLLSSFGSDTSPLSYERIYWKQQTVLYQAQQPDIRQKSFAAESVEASCSGDCSEPKTDGEGGGAELKPVGTPRHWLGNKASQYCMEREHPFVPGGAVSDVIRAGGETRVSVLTNRRPLGFVSCFETVVTADSRQCVHILQHPSFVPLRLQFERRVPLRNEHLRFERRTPLFLPNGRFFLCNDASAFPSHLVAGAQA